jgi:hypothetical protein
MDHVVCASDAVRQTMADEVGRQLERPSSSVRASSGGREIVHILPELPTLVVDASTTSMTLL